MFLTLLFFLPVSGHRFEKKQDRATAVSAGLRKIKVFKQECQQQKQKKWAVMFLADKIFRLMPEIMSQHVCHRQIMTGMLLQNDYHDSYQAWNMMTLCSFSRNLSQKSLVPPCPTFRDQSCHQKRFHGAWFSILSCSTCEGMFLGASLFSVSLHLEPSFNIFGLCQLMHGTITQK